ncbi:hypothetical protein ALI22I_29265 [Saccharothrix sp. ALI-22-I]|uniref:hypothetical protein n=1 Tax=Saccharothrix sp. ALI-22-I TaxID=1933778 RepID=UPI00097C5F18|nr:hypothetical protein [Saccharothrix sp. ALI-22-I]ONI84634.1 hypothetical protein ALI22I_29265 [Saccharothrix sp. ALI-22-I]
MNAVKKAVAATGVGAAVVLGGRAVGRRREAHRDRSEHWLAVTIDRPFDAVSGLEALPGPLEELRAHVDLRLRPAPGDRGTEVLAVPKDDDVSREDLRVALRKTKSLIETGTVIQPDTPPTTHPGPLGRVLRLVVGKSAGEGRL